MNLKKLHKYRVKLEYDVTVNAPNPTEAIRLSKLVVQGLSTAGTSSLGFAEAERIE